MLNAQQQEQIIKANNEAFEELARRWRDPQTGETELDLREAVLKMVCDYFSVPGCGSDDLYRLISGLQDEALGGDKRDPIELMEGEIPSELRASLKRLYTDRDPGCWCWDDGEWEWDWELSLRDAQEDVDCGYVAIIPLKDGHRLEYNIKPPFSHREWAIKFVVGLGCPTILVKGPLQKAKRRLDLLIGFTTPEIRE